MNRLPTTFKVEISYHTPTYDTRHDHPMKVHTAVYVVKAPSAEDAVRQAVEEFRQTEAESSVRWSREILGTVACAL